MKKISFIFPVYNGASSIEGAVRAATKAFRGMDYEIIISENGSTDGSAGVADRVARKYGRVMAVHSSEPGKGLALRRAIAAARGNCIIFSDIDLSYDLSYARQFMRCIEKGADVCIGSRYTRQGGSSRVLKRELFSRVYIGLVRALFRTRISDFQCGFKAFSRSSVPVLLKARDGGFFWDTEMLLEAERAGLRIGEVPVASRDSATSSVRVSRVAPRLFMDLLRYRLATIIRNSA